MLLYRASYDENELIMFWWLSYRLKFAVKTDWNGQIPVSFRHIQLLLLSLVFLLEYESFCWHCDVVCMLNTNKQSATCLCNRKISCWVRTFLLFKINKTYNTFYITVILGAAWNFYAVQVMFWLEKCNYNSITV